MANKDKNPPYVAVAPFVGAWIEIGRILSDRAEQNVAPFVGAWIEIWVLAWELEKPHKSLPSWERGLKLLSVNQNQTPWCRSLRGSVD